MVTSDAAVVAIATSLKNSDGNLRTFLLTKDFLNGESTAVSASKLRLFTGIPYSRETLDKPGQVSDNGLSPKSFAECEAYLASEDRGDGTSGEAINTDNCEAVSTWLINKGAPNNFLTPYDPNFGDDKEANRIKAEEWWHVLSCGRTVLSYNAQCVDDLNKAEQQALFTPYADNDLYPYLMDMMNGEGDFDYSGPEGEFRIYFTEFSRLVQKYHLR